MRCFFFISYDENDLTQWLTVLESNGVVQAEYFGHVIVGLKTFPPGLTTSNAEKQVKVIDIS